MRVNLISIFIAFFLISCGDQIDFVYKSDKSLKNPIYNDTLVSISGINIPSVYKYSSMFFGNNSNGTYVLDIYVEEEKSKRSVQDNQAIKKEDFKITYRYQVYNTDLKCSIFAKNIVSIFTYEPKSSGYNFGSDQSLENLYELATKDSLQRFVDLLVNINFSLCLNES